MSAFTMLAVKSLRHIAVALTLYVCGAGAAHAQNPGTTLEPNTMGARLAACTACHGAQGRAGPDGYYPRIAGKPAEYLFHQLLSFRDGQRQYRPMTHLLTGLPDAYLREMAEYFASRHVPYPPPAQPRADAAALERGRALVFDGDRSRRLPACAACHGADLSGVAPAIPGLLGLPRDYLVAQIGGWQQGLRQASAPDCMADVARQLSPEDVAAVAAWLAAQPVPPFYVAQPSGTLKLPTACGSQTRSAVGGTR